MPEWLNGLRHSIGAFHLQNTDFQSDSHWGWPDRRGLFDVAGFAGEVRAAGLEDVPAFIEIIYPFELADEAVLKNITSTVEHCRREYAPNELSSRPERPAPACRGSEVEGPAVSLHPNS
jgi:D-erythrulose 1-phosphate 3-epimerase